MTSSSDRPWQSGGQDSPRPPDSLQPLQSLQSLLGGPALVGLRHRLRQACAALEPGQVPGARRFTGLNAAECDALQALTGRAPKPSRSLMVDLAELDARLRAAGLADGLHAALVAIDGPILTRHARAASAEAWAALALGAPIPALRSLLAEPRRLGLLKRLAGGEPDTARQLCLGAARVLAALPGAGMPRARLAAACLGDAHALDEGAPVATLVLAALRQDAIDADADSSRALWASQGVAVNELARPVLTLNLPEPDAAPSGEPLYWSLRRLLRKPPAWLVAGQEVFVCENPNLMALAADALGAQCAPLVCTDGMPAAAQHCLLDQLVRAGAALNYHGDFDWPGISIGNLMMQRFGARPWRFSASDYRSALHGQPDPASAHSAGLAAQPVAATWDAQLSAAMVEAGVAVPEEALFDSLQTDLATPVAARGPT